MTKKTTTTNDNHELHIVPISTGTVRVGIVGTSPMIYNRMTEKAKQELLYPKARMNRAEKEANVKHNPPEEYRSSVYQFTDSKAPTRLFFPAAGFKKAMASAAKDMPGATKAEIGRLTWIKGLNVPVFGAPQMFMAVTRSAGMNRVPDVRTRAILPEWAAIVDIEFVRPILTSEAVGTLMAAAGLIAGLGDGRQEKGWGSYGQFRVADVNDPDLKRIMREGGRVAQDAALANPQCYDADTEELLSWFSSEFKRRRSDDVVVPLRRPRKKAA